MCSYFCHHMPLSSLCHTWPVPARLGSPHCSTQMSKRCRKTDRYSIFPTNKKVCIGIIKGNHSACISSVVSIIQYRTPYQLHSGTVLYPLSYLTLYPILFLSYLKFYPFFPYTFTLISLSFIQFFPILIVVSYSCQGIVFSFSYLILS